MPGLLESIQNMFSGGMPTTYKDERAPAWPSPADVAAAQQYDLSYGSPVAAFVQPRAVSGRAAADRISEATVPAKMKTYTNEDAFLRDWNELGRSDSAQPQRLSAGQQSQLAQAYSAAQKSALAALGFDPRQFAMARPEQPFDLTAAGVTGKESNMAATTGQFPSTIAHESMHRGVNILQQMGLLPPSAQDIKLGEGVRYAHPTNMLQDQIPNPDETIVRALMARAYGPVEMGRGEAGDEQVKQGQRFITDRYFSSENNQILNDLENAAAQLIAKRTPRGPR